MGHRPPTDRPTRTRFVVLAFLCALSFVLYIDRVAISQAAPAIQKELDLTTAEMSYVFMAFTLAYGLCEIPVGHMGDRVGGRRVLTRIVVCWSAFTALTAACGSLWSLLAVRFLFGAGEAGAIPNVARVIRRWFPRAERGRAQGLFMAGAQCGAAATPVVAASLILLLGWKWVFVLFGLVGVVWAAAFWWWFRDDPADHPSANAAERDHIRAADPPAPPHPPPVPWPAALGHRTLWLMAGIIVCASFNSYLYFSWYPTYLQKGRGAGALESGWLASLVLAGSAVGMLTSGFLADAITRRARDPVRVRQRLGASCYAAAAGLLFLSIRADSAVLSAGLVAVSSAVVYLPHANWWTCMTEISGPHVGTFFGFANGMGVFGAMASQWFIGWCADWRGRSGFGGRDQWDPALYAYVGALLVAAVCWRFADSSRPVAGEE